MIVSDSFNVGPISAYRFGYHPYEKPTLQVIIYVLDGMMIDVGQSRCRNRIFNTLQGLDISQIYITHHHEDHTGNLNELKGRYKCPIYGSEMTASIIKDPPSISFSQWVIWGGRKSFDNIIPISGKIETDKYEFQLLDIPGHAPDMTALYVGNEGWLFSSDLYLNSYIGYYLWSESMAKQIQSIRKILPLDFDALLCAHNPKVKNGKVQLANKLQFLEDFYGEVESHFSKGLSEKEIFLEMGLKEAIGVKLLSGGALSKINMVRSVIRDVKSKEEL